MRPLWFEEQDPDLSFQHMTRVRKKKDRLGKKEQAKKRTPIGRMAGLGPDTQTPKFLNANLSAAKAQRTI